MNKKIPSWVINKRIYNSNRTKELGIKGFCVRIPIEQFNEIDNYLKKNNLTRGGFIKKIIEKYK